MTYQPGRHIYFAAGFFNDEQRDLCSFVEGFNTDVTPIYSPRLDGGVLKPDSPTEEIEAVFDSNCVSITTANWMLAVIDDFDPGVIWEMGYGYAHGIPILGYSDVKGRGLNVMLAGACNLGFVNGREDLEVILSSNSPLSLMPKNTWSGEIQ